MNNAPRQIRRAAEREARKAENKQPQAPLAAAATPAPAELIETDELHTISEARLAANRANAQHSTGPATEAGKEKSSQNRITYGLSRTFRLLGCKDPE